MSKFKELWDNYPDKNLMKARCQNKQKNGSKPFGNYCAIMLSEALIKSGVSTVSVRAKIRAKKFGFGRLNNYG